MSVWEFIRDFPPARSSYTKGSDEVSYVRCFPDYCPVDDYMNSLKNIFRVNIAKLAILGDMLLQKSTV
jgi:hypothetical protein